MLNYRLKSMLKPVAIVTSILAALFFWVMQTETSESKLDAQHQTEDRDNKPNLALQVPSQEVNAATESTASKNLDKVPGSAAEPVLYNALNQRFQNIARDFEKNMRFPPYAKPLSPKDWALLNPRPFTPMTVPVANLQGISVQIETPHYIVDAAHPLPISVVARYSNLAGNDEITSVRISLQGDEAITDAVMLSKEATSKELKPNPEMPKRINKPTHQSDAIQRFSGTLLPNHLAMAGVGNVLIRADITFSQGYEFTTATTVKLYKPTATLTEVGTPIVDGPHLKIPLTFSVTETGIYRVRANLLDADTDKPISHLSATLNLTEQSGEGYLKAHAVTLRAQSAPGPYTLTHINITKAPAAPGDATGYGSSLKTAYGLPGFDLDHYSNEIYDDPAMKQRLAFLQKLAGIE